MLLLTAYRNSSSLYPTVLSPTPYNLRFSHNTCVTYRCSGPLLKACRLIAWSLWSMYVPVFMRKTVWWQLKQYLDWTSCTGWDGVLASVDTGHTQSWRHESHSACNVNVVWQLSGHATVRCVRSFLLAQTICKLYITVSDAAYCDTFPRCVFSLSCIT